MPSRSTGTSSAPPDGIAALRAWGRIARIAADLALCLPLHGLWRLARARSPWPRVFLRRLARSGGIDVRIVGIPLPRDVLFAANHLTWFDIPVLAGATGARFVSKAEVARWPLIGFLANLNGTIYVARAERGRVAEQAAQVRDALAEGTPVALFPEGGTGDGMTLRPFRASLLAALVPPLARVRVQPVAIDYGAERGVVAWTGDLGFGREMMRLLRLAGRREVTLHFLDPLDPVSLPDRKRLAAAAEQAVGIALGAVPAATL